MSDFAIPSIVSDRLVQLGDRVRTARARRGWSSAALAAKAGIARRTLMSLEQGKPGTSLGVALTVLWALGLDAGVEAVANPDTDLHGKALEASRRPKRVRERREDDTYDF